MGYSVIGNTRGFEPLFPGSSPGTPILYLFANIKDSIGDSNE